MDASNISYISYIWPKEILLDLVIIGMWVVAGIVIRQILKIRSMTQENLTMMDQIADVHSLGDTVLKEFVNPKEVFEHFETEKGKTDKTAILFDHVRVLYEAGVKSSRLDAELLVKNSIEKIFAGTDFLKTCISMFLVMGILGTLLGLAISIGSFSGSNFSLVTQTSGTANELSLLFTNLRGAFAPSMWGVFMTISFVFAYSWFIQEKCVNQLTEKLTLHTIKDWLPVLYPTDFQRTDNSIIKLNHTIQNADGIDKGVHDLKSNLEESNQTLKALANVSKKITAASEKFDKSTDKIVRVSQIYDGLKKSNEQFQSSLHSIIAGLQSSQQQDREHLRQQTSAMSAALHASVTDFYRQVSGQMNTLAQMVQGQDEHVGRIVKSIDSYSTQLYPLLNDLNRRFGSGVKRNESAVSTMEKAANQFTAVRGELNAVQSQLKTNSTEMQKGVQNMMEQYGRALGEQNERIQQVLGNLGKSLQELNEYVSTTNFGDGISPRDQQRLASQIANASGGQAMTEKLNGILTILERAYPQEEESRQHGFLSIKNLPIILIAFLLLISVIVQGVMVNKISNLEQSQTAITQSINHTGK